MTSRFHPACPRLFLVLLVSCVATGRAAVARDAPPLPPSSPPPVEVSPPDAPKPGAFATGKVIAKVVTLHDAGQSYALYLPKAYAPEKKWPILYGFSPGGRGTDPVRLFKGAAEKYGWIVVGSNNSRNNVPFAQIRTALDAIWKDTHARLSIDDARLYGTGFSGGARVSSAFAVTSKTPFAGVIFCGAGLAPGVRWPEKDGPVVCLVGGTGGFNYGELLRLDALLSARKARHRLVTFEGDHRWPPFETAAAALRYIELHWRLGHAGAGDAAVAEMLDLERADAEALLERKGEFLRALARFKELAGLLADAEAGKPFAARAAEIEKLERYAKEKAALDALVALPADLARIGNDAKFNEALMKLAALAREHAGTDAAARARARLRLLAARLMMAGNQYHAAGRYKEAVIFLARTRRLAPKEPTVAYNLACALARGGAKEAALKVLAESVELGFRNAAHMKKDPDLESLRDAPEYKALIEKLGTGEGSAP